MISINIKLHYVYMMWILSCIREIKFHLHVYKRFRVLFTYNLCSCDERCEEQESKWLVKVDVVWVHCTCAEGPEYRSDRLDATYGRSHKPP